MRLKEISPPELMEEYLLHLPRQVEHGYEIGRSCKLPAEYLNVKNILFCGVGGSAIGGDIIAELMDAESPIPFQVNRQSRVPAWVDSDTLAIFSSYSGNTAETLAAFQSAHHAGAKILVLTAGGVLLEKAKSLRLPHVIIPSVSPPRCAIGYLTISLLPLLASNGWISFSKRDVDEIISSIKKPPRQKARKIAAKLKDKFLFLYGNDRFMAPVVRRWRAQFAENSKCIASHHLLPEMLHNEIEGWNNPGNFAEKSAALFIWDADLAPKIRGKIKATQALLRSKGTLVITISAEKKSLLSRIFCLISLGDWVSYELAKLYNVDPVPIPTIEKLKKKYN